MPKIKFTKSTLEKLAAPPGERVDYFDTETRGLGLRVGNSSKTFFVKVDIRDAGSKTGYRSVRKTLGRFGEITLEQARKEIQGYDDRDKGFVPGVRLEIKRGQTKMHGSDVTLAQMLEAYFLEKKTAEGNSYKPSTVRGYTNIVTRHFETWLSLPLAEIGKLTPEVVIDRYRQAEIGHGPYGARNAFVMLAAIINYARVKYPGVVATNPLAVLRFGKHMKKIQARTERLEGKEFGIFYQGIQKFNENIRDCYLFCLYHGLRSQEAATLRWEYVNLDRLTLTIPDTKNRRPLYAPLCRQSLEILERRLAQREEGCPFVFPAVKTVRYSTNKTGHVRLMATALKLNTGLNITVHGLRRTFITTARRLKIFEDADRLTNHVDSTISGRHYDATDVEDLRRPLQTIAGELERLMKEGTAKVLQLH
ncbi:tyrosine-type recombinase/integrase [Geomonas anaerohicana]|uniref:Integrase family protein n=1 Tax=Geomonas anaerohicana TaxID=2798583 RepID=A0ABS0Y9M8_9BACT|nr:integrase family protein [Geomonas anaerohicana]MBJ6749018.1 integrase family protein [Geomonas anaerohicana]